VIPSYLTAPRSQNSIGHKKNLDPGSWLTYVSVGTKYQNLTDRELNLVFYCYKLRFWDSQEGGSTVLQFVKRALTEEP